MTGSVSAHDPTRIAEELAELIGQMQHLIELQEALIGRNPYDPLIVDLSKGVSQTIYLPAEAHQLELAQVSGDTACTIKFLRVSERSGPAGQLIGQVYMSATSVAPPLQLNCPIPPEGCQLIITTSAPVVNGACVITLCRTRPGGYPYAG